MVIWCNAAQGRKSEREKIPGKERRDEEEDSFFVLREEGGAHFFAREEPLSVFRFVPTRPPHPTLPPGRNLVSNTSAHLPFLFFPAVKSLSSPFSSSSFPLGAQATQFPTKRKETSFPFYAPKGGFFLAALTSTLKYV